MTAVARPQAPRAWLQARRRHQPTKTRHPQTRCRCHVWLACSSRYKWTALASPWRCPMRWTHQQPQPLRAWRRPRTWGMARTLPRALASTRRKAAMVSVARTRGSQGVCPWHRCTAGNREGCTMWVRQGRPRALLCPHLPTPMPSSTFVDRCGLQTMGGGGLHHDVLAGVARGGGRPCPLWKLAAAWVAWRRPVLQVSVQCHRRDHAHAPCSRAVSCGPRNRPAASAACLRSSSLKSGRRCGRGSIFRQISGHVHRRSRPSTCRARL